MMKSRLRSFMLPTGCILLSVAAFYPGFLSFDSAYQFWQVRSGEYSNISPVAMTAFWSMIHGVWPGSGGVFLLHMLAFWIGLWISACALFSRTRSRITATLLAGCISPSLLILAHLWTDAALIASLTLGSALILAAERYARPSWLYTSIPFLLYGGVVRHNALIALLPLVLLWFVAYSRLHPSAANISLRQLASSTVLATAAIFTFGWILDSTLVSHRVKTFAVVQMWDLAAISIEEQRMLLPDFVRPASLTIHDLSEKYTPYTNVPLYTGNPAISDGFGRPFSEEERKRLSDAWLASIRQYPSAYIAHRWAVTKALFGRYRNDRPQALAYVPTIVQYRDNPKIRANSSIFNSAAKAWYRMSIGWWISAPLFYLLLAIGCTAAAWQRRSDFRGKFALASALSGILYTLPLTVAAPSAELRYSSWLFVSSLLALLALLATNRYSVYLRTAKE